MFIFPIVASLRVHVLTEKYWILKDFLRNFHPLSAARGMLVGGFKHDWIIIHSMYGTSSFPLTNSYYTIFQDGRIAPPTSG
jgi:hypothetical protein